jgi:hypothetical protein
MYDGSTAMLEKLKEAYAEFGARVLVPDVE